MSFDSWLSRTPDDADPQCENCTASVGPYDRLCLRCELEIAAEEERDERLVEEWAEGECSL